MSNIFVQQIKMIKMTALSKLNYVVDDEGKPVFVQIPIQEWTKFLEEHRRLTALLAFKERFNTAFREVRDIRNGKKKTVTLSDFLNEL